MIGGLWLSTGCSQALMVQARIPGFEYQHSELKHFYSIAIAWNPYQVEYQQKARSLQRVYMGQVENAEVRKPLTETEVRKPKYGSEKKIRLLVSSALLTHDCAL